MCHSNHSICLLLVTIIGIYKMTQFMKSIFVIITIGLITSNIWAQHSNKIDHQHKVTHNLDIYDTNFKKELSFITNITKGFAKRYRPFNYNPNVADEMKLGNTSRLSFFSGHTSATAMKGNGGVSLMIHL